MKAIVLLACGALGLLGCRREVAKPQGDASTATSLADASAAAAAAAPELVPDAGRVFFGKSPTRVEAIATNELYVRRDGHGVVALLDDEELPSPTLDAAGHLRSVNESGEPLDLALHADGTFDGARTYKDGSKTQWVQAPYRPLDPEQLASPVGFFGLLGDKIVYRMKLAAHGEAVEGVARYAATREDFRVRGTLHRDTRAIALDELDRDGKVTGHIEGHLLGHRTAPGYSESTHVVGTWASPDGARRFAMRLDENAYPERVTVAGGAALSAQEHYEDDCGTIQQYVFPAVDGAPPAVVTALDPKLKAITLRGPSPDPLDAATLARAFPGQKIRRGSCARKNPETRGTESGIYEATPLHDAWVAIEIEHYAQQGSVSGNVWHDCVAVDLATGELVEPSTLLDASSRAKLQARARKAAVADLADAGPTEDPRLLDGMREAAATLTLENVPLCIEKDKVRFALTRHRVFGPDHPLFDRDEVARLLPPGKLRDLVQKPKP